MRPVTAQWVANAVGGVLAADVDAVVTSVVKDSRDASPGSLYVAFVGERVDGHAFADAALSAGATLCLVSQEIDGPHVLVDDVERALGALARAYLALLRTEGDITVLGITGSNGKTTTKDLLAQTLPNVVAPVGSYNNEIGMPLTVLAAGSDTRFLVLEMGASGPGHIAYLTEIAPLDIAVVLMVGTAHAGGYDGPDGIARAKAEIVRGLVPGGVAVLNADDAAVAGMAPLAERGVTFGQGGNADVQASELTLTKGRASFVPIARGASGPRITLSLVGEHHVTNALAAISAALECGLGLATAAERVAAAGPMSAHRMAVTERHDGITVIDDSYNASPESMRAAFRALLDVADGGRTVAVIGEMLEMGDMSREAHWDIGHNAVRLGIDYLLVVGEGAKPAFDAAVREGSWGDEAAFVGSIGEARGYLAERLVAGDTVLVKASHGAGLYELADELVRENPWKAVVAAGAIALLISLFVTPLFIRFQRKRGLGQFIRQDGPETHHVKRGTPQMGGVVIIGATLVGWFLANLTTGDKKPEVSSMLVLFLMCGLGLVGFLDDILKISKERSLGLRARYKILGQAIVGITFGVLALQFPDEAGITPASTAVSFLRDTVIDFGALGGAIGLIFFIIWANFLITAWSNAVNLTDGLDGLATGASVIFFGAYVLVCLWQLQQKCGFTSNVAQCYEVRDPRDLAIVCSAIAGACVGFLWWNASPARIFMGDTGALALGGAIAGVTLMTRTELLGVVIGGLFVMVIASSVIQIGYFKLSGGKRVFKMAPIHHHFELLGWGQVTIVTRFWIIAGLCAGAGMGIFYQEWVSQQ